MTFSQDNIARARLAAGSGNPPTPEEKRARSIGHAWRYNSEIEHLIAHPELLDKLPARTAATYRMSIGSYKAAKETARELGLDVSGGR